MTISIIGCGWLGLPLAQDLLRQGHQVKGSTTSSNKLPGIARAGIDAFLIDLNPDFHADPEGFFPTDLLIVNIPPRNRDDDSHFHLKQLTSLKDAALTSSSPNVIYISSTGVYPNLNRIVTEEDASASALSRGGVPLVEAEDVFRTSDMPCTALRFGGLYGPGRHPGRFLAGRSDLAGASNPVNMIHLDDCIGAINAIIDQDLWNETFSVCSPHHPTRQKFYEEAAAALQIPAPTFSDVPLDYKEVSVEKFISETGYQFRH